MGLFLEQLWDKDIVPTLTDYIRIPNKSPAFDPKRVEHGHMDKVVAMFESWAREKIAKLPGASLEVVRLEGRTPLIFIEVPGNAKDTVLLYGHMDKQPEMVGWAEGTGPWQPVIKGDRLYGRGGADDGYAMFAAVSTSPAKEAEAGAACSLRFDRGLASPGVCTKFRDVRKSLLGRTENSSWRR